MIPKSWRVKIFNWFSAGKLTLTYEKPGEYNLMSYTLGGGSGSLTINPNGSYGSGTTNDGTLTIKVTPANGGTIVQVNTSDYVSGALHIIPDGTDFDRELGKIITMSKLKA